METKKEPAAPFDPVPNWLAIPGKANPTKPLCEICCLWQKHKMLKAYLNPRIFNEAAHLYYKRIHPISQWLRPRKYIIDALIGYSNQIADVILRNLVIVSSCDICRATCRLQYFLNQRQCDIYHQQCSSCQKKYLSSSLTYCLYTLDLKLVCLPTNVLLSEAIGERAMSNH